VKSCASDELGMNPGRVETIEVVNVGVNVGGDVKDMDVKPANSQVAMNH
jgi:hypothetical protein